MGEFGNDKRCWWGATLRQAQGERNCESCIGGVGDAMGVGGGHAPPLWIPAFAGMTRWGGGGGDKRCWRWDGPSRGSGRTGARMAPTTGGWRWLGGGYVIARDAMT